MVAPKKQRIELGYSSFIEIRKIGALVVDKTMVIQHVLDSSHRSMLIPRPRRFGKTFNMGMLKAFFEKRDEDFSPYFEGLQIWDSPEARLHFQKHPVIHLSFSGCKGLNWDAAWELIRLELVNTLSEHKAILTTPGILTDEDADWYQHGLSETLSPQKYGQLLRILSQGLHRLHGAQVVILIDEYDTPIHNALERGFYPQAVEFFKGFLNKGFKDNDALFRGVITGILRVSKENMFSDLNNVKVYSLLNEHFKTDFGLTEEEVIQVLDSQGCPELLPQLQAMYNGYRFGSREPVAIYNPWSTLCCIADSHHNLEPYWNKSGSPELLHQLVVKNGPAIHADLQKLLDVEKLEVLITENVNLTALDSSPTDLFSFMLFTGYLRADSALAIGEDWQVTLALVNQELHLILRRLYRDWLQQGLGSAGSEPLVNAILEGDASAFQALLETILHRNASFMDGVTRKPENFYQGLLLGLLLVMKEQYHVFSNLEAGKGRADLLLLPRTPGRPGAVLELKVVQEGGSLTAALLEGLEQLQERRYTSRLEEFQAQPAQALAVAFDGKKVRVAGPAQRTGLEAERAESERSRREKARPTRRAQRSTKGTRGAKRPALDLDTRLALEDRVLPLLDAASLTLLWIQCGGLEEELKPGPPVLQWTRLVMHCQETGQLPQLARLLERLVPTLKGEPLLETLRPA